MKKGLLILLTVSMITTLTACGSSDESKSEQESAEGVKEAEGLTIGESTEADSEDEEWTSGKYAGMNFSYPSDSDYSESDDSVTITITPSEKIMFLYAQEMDSDFAEKYLPEANLSILSTFENANYEKSYDLTIDGNEALGETGDGDFSGWHLYYKIASVYDEKSENLYTIEYTSTTDDDEDAAIYDTFIDSISFD